jgi:hypothetical protein
MANVDSPFGLRPLEYQNGTPWNGQARRYYIASGLAETIYIGDPVILAGSADATGKYPTVQLATLADGNYTIGPVVAFEADPTNLNKTYHVASTAQYCWVADDPNIIFEIQMDSATDLAVTDVGCNGIMVRTHSGSTVTGLSGVEADESDFANADASNMLLLLGLVDRADNTLATHCKVKVLISRQVHQYGAGYGA